MSLRDILKKSDCTGCLVVKLDKEIKKLKQQIADFKDKEAEENKKLEDKITTIDSKKDKFISTISVKNDKIIFDYADGSKQELPLSELEQKEDGKDEVWQ